MGSVYRVRRLSDDAELAVKFITLSGLESWKALELFERGASVLQELDHVGLPKVHDVGQSEEGLVYLVREAFLGGTLHDRIAGTQRRLSQEVFRGLMASSLEILTYLHELVPPVFHRDIKPQNIMFRTDDDWDPVLVDFDTVSETRQQGGMTIVGTPGYTAPEQFAGIISPASDLYSLGATLLFVATHSDPDTLERKEERFVVEHLLTSMTRPLRRVLLRMVEPERAGRHESARQAAQEVRQAREASLGASLDDDSTVAPGEDAAAAPEARQRLEELRGRFPRQRTIDVPSPAGADLEDEIDRAEPWATIRLGPGEYHLRAPLAISTALLLEADDPDRTRILCEGPAVLRATGDDFFGARGVGFERTGYQPGSVVLVEGCPFFFDGCHFRGAIKEPGSRFGDTGSGLALSGDAAGIVAGCKAEDNARCGVILRGDAEAAAEGNTLTRNGVCGIAFTDRTGGVARGNLCQNSKLHGILVRDEARPALVDNTCNNNREAGISSKVRSAPEIRGNTCSDNGADGIYFEDEAAVDVQDNTCENNGDSGIYFNGSGSGQALRNRCRKNRKRGIAAAGRSQVAVEENICAENDLTGISFYSNARGSARRNQCHDNVKQGIFAGGEARPTLEDNTCRRNGEYGIHYRQAGAGEARGNELTENGIDGIYLREEAHPVLEANSCHRNKEAGISYLDRAAGVARRNDCCRNLQYGIYLQDRARPRLEKNSCLENTSHGISYNGKSRGDAVENTCSKNAGCGIVVRRSARPALEGNITEDNEAEDLRDERGWLARKLLS